MVSPPLPRMIMSWFYVIVFYSIRILSFFNYNNPILFWILIELNLLSFSLILLLDKRFSLKKDRLNYLVFYFLIQSRASILFLSNFCFGEWGSIFNVDMIFLISMILKIGLFPLFFWVYRIRGSLRFTGLFLLLTSQKIPLLLGLFSCRSTITFYILSFSLFSGSLILFFRVDFVSMLISSSISYRFIMYLLFCYSPLLFITFFFIYRGFVFLSLSSFFERSLVSHKFLFIFFSFFIGLPPLRLFFYKYIFSCELTLLTGSSEMLMFWAFRLVSLVGYLKFFYFSFYERVPLYLKNEFCFKTRFLIYSVFSFFLLFLC